VLGWQKLRQGGERLVRLVIFMGLLWLRCSTKKDKGISVGRRVRERMERFNVPAPPPLPSWGLNEYSFLSFLHCIVLG